MTRHEADLGRVLTGNAYPGRGILCARTGDGSVVGGYFVTGRSQASREREIRPTETGELAVAAGDRPLVRARRTASLRNSGVYGGFVLAMWTPFPGTEVPNAEVSTKAGQLHLTKEVEEIKLLLAPEGETQPESRAR